MRCRTYTLNELNSSDNVCTGFLCLFRCSAFRKHENAVLLLGLWFSRQRVTAFRNSLTAFWLLCFNDEFVGGIRRCDFYSLDFVLVRTE